jgi:NB-ARC domain
MSDSRILSVKPIIHYPRVAQVGKTYLMTIDLEVEAGAEWQYEEEEYPIYCTVDSELFSSKPMGEPVVVLHRFGGSYGASKFLLESSALPQQGTIRIVLVNRYGVPIKSLNLENIRLLEKVELGPEILPDIQVSSTSLRTAGIHDLSIIIAENLQLDPIATVEALVERLKDDDLLIQICEDNAVAFQTLVEEGGTANVGIHLHDFDEDKLDEVLKAFWQSLQLAKIPNNIPRSGVAKFIGRKPELERLHTQLQQGNLISISAIEGMGGVGKTELAIQYTQRYADVYPGGIAWLFAREFNLGTQVVGFAQSQLNLKIPEGLELPDQVAFCWRNWCEGEVLLVLDDVVNYSRDVEPYLPPPASNRFKVVMTTRLTFGPQIQSLCLDVLSPEQSLELLTTLIGEKHVQKELDIVKTLCNWLGHLPLAIELVGHYLREHTQYTLTALFFRLQEKAQQRQAIRHAALNKNEETITSTGRRGIEASFELSWEELDGNSQHLGKLLSLFAPAPIPWYLAEAVERKYCEDSDSGKEFELEKIEVARARLIDLHLLQQSQQEGEIYYLHSLVREFFRSKLEGESDIKDSFDSGLTTKAANVQKTIHILSTSTTSIQESLQSKLEIILCDQEVESYEIPDDNHLGTIQSIYDLDLLYVYTDRIKYHDNEQIQIPFKVRVEALLSYFIFKADYYALGEERDISVDENNDHTFSAEENYSLEVEGLVLIDLNLDEFEDSILSDNEISVFLSEIEISIEPTIQIEVLPQKIRYLL